MLSIQSSVMHYKAKMVKHINPNVAKYSHIPPGKGWSVVYAIVHKKTGRTYVGKHCHLKTGKSVAKSRWAHHASKFSGCIRIRNSMQKHGAKAFVKVVIERCPSEGVV